MSPNMRVALIGEESGRSIALAIRLWSLSMRVETEENSGLGFGPL